MGGFCRQADGARALCRLAGSGDTERGGRHGGARRFDGFAVVLRAPREFGDHQSRSSRKSLRATTGESCLEKGIAEYKAATP